MPNTFKATDLVSPSQGLLKRVAKDDEGPTIKGSFRDFELAEVTANQLYMVHYVIVLPIERAGMSGALHYGNFTKA